jgi:hypothetical protein
MVATTASGTAAPTVGAETTLATINPASGVYQTYIDASALAIGDTIVIKNKTNINSSGGTQGPATIDIFCGPVAVPIVLSAPCIADSWYQATLTQVTGTARSFPWKVLSATAVVAAAAQGTQAATIGTEATLATLTTANVFHLYVDLTNLSLGDIVELRTYQAILTGGALKCQELTTFAYPVSAPFAVLTPVQSDGQFSATLCQTDGSGKSFDWKIFKF